MLKERPYRLPLGIGILCGCAIALLWAGLIFEFRRAEDAALGQARKDVTNLALGFREHVRSLFDGVDLLTLTIIDQQPDKPDEYRIPTWVDNSLLLKKLGLQVGLIGPDGTLAASNLGFTGRVDLSDRSHFSYHLDPGAPEPYISVPVPGRVSGKWSIQVARRITRRDGGFGGVAVVSVDPSYFANFLNSLDLGAGGIAALTGMDGIVRARRGPGPKEFGQDLSKTPLFRYLRDADEGSFTTRSGVDGVERLYGYSKVPGYPLVVGIGRSTADILATTRRERAFGAAGGALLTLVVLVLSSMLISEANRRRSRAVELIDQQKMHLDAALNNISQGIVLYDNSGQMVLCNRRYIEMYGLSPDAVKAGCTAPDLLALRRAAGNFSGNIEQYHEDILAGLRAGGPWRRITEPGDGRMIEVVNNPIPDGGWVSTHEDITARQIAETALVAARAEAEEAEQHARAAHARLRDAIEVVPEGLAFFDADDRYVLWNRQYAQNCADVGFRLVHGLRFEDLLRTMLANGQCLDAVGREDEWLASRLALHAEPQATHEQGMATGRWFKTHERRTADGGSVTVRVDISDLKKSEESFRLLFETNPLPMYVIDRENMHVLAVNDAALAHYGYTREQFLTLTLLDIRPAEDREKFAQAFVHLPDISERHAWRHQKADGTVFEAEVYSRLLNYGGSKARLAAVVDVSDRLRVEAQLRQAQKMEAVGNLTGGLAHDFNNLLLIIMVNADLLKDDIVADRAAAEKVDAITQASLRGAELTQQLLAFSRRQPLQPKLVRLDVPLSDMMRLLTRTLGTDIRVDWKVGTDTPPVLVDEAQLEAAIVNLAINARDAMPNGGTLWISTAGTRLDPEDVSTHAGLAPGNYAVITVTDTGAGMPPDVLARAFEPFFTTKGSKGTGLGLSMVYGFIKQSGGHITAYSEVGKGTTFKLYLPAAPHAALEVPATDSGQPIPVRGGEVILAVDDNHDVRTAVTRQLRELGYVVVAAENAEIALHQLESMPKIDLLFTDVVMPGIDGRELARRARAVRPHLKVLFTSGFPGTRVGDMTDFAGGEAFLSKPYRTRDLAKKIRDTLNA